MNVDTGEQWSSQVSSAVTVMPPIEVANIQSVKIQQSNVISLTGGETFAAKYSEGQIVALPAGTANFPLGYTGRVLTKTTTAGQTVLELQPATVPEVFKNLKVDFDTLRDNARIVGVIAPQGGKTTVKFTNLTRRNQIGLSQLTDSELGFKGNISTTLDLKNGVKLVLEGTVDSLRIIKKMEYTPPVPDAQTGAGTTTNPSGTALSTRAADYKKVISEITGELGVTVKLEGEVAKGNSEVLDMSSIWKDLESQGALTGLNDDDKRGLIPLAGLVIQSGITPFVGDINSGVAALAKQGGVVVWLYLNLKGELTLKGDITVLSYKTGFSQKFNLTPTNDNQLESSQPQVPTPPTSLTSGIHATADYTQKIGVTVAADLFIAGIRPLAVQFTPAAFELNAAFSGNADYDWYEKKFSGSICVDHIQAKLGAQFLARAALGVTIKNWSLINGQFEYKYDFDPYWQDSGSITAQKCIVSGNLDFALNNLGADPVNPKNALYEIDLSHAFAGLDLQRDAKLAWGLTVNNTTTPALVAGWAAGTYNFVTGEMSPFTKRTLSLPSGSTYRFNMQSTAAGLDLQYKTAEKTITVLSPPTVDFTFGLIANDCRRLSLAASGGSFGAGEIVSTWVWEITNAGAQFPAITTTQPNVDAALSVCGATKVVLSAITSTGRKTIAVKTFDTNLLIVKVTGVSPLNATIGETKTFSITGQNLPLTAVVSLVDSAGSCLTLASPAQSSAGFSVTCVPGGPVGGKTVTIKTDTLANGGTIIDASKTVSVAATPVASTGKLPDTGITASQCYAAGSDVLVSCTSAAAIALNNQQDGMVGRDVANNNDADGKAGFSYSVVPDPSGISGLNFPKTACVKDNITGLVWEGKPADGGYRDFRKTYTNYGNGMIGDASAYVAAVNAAGLCGATDWRLPTADELQGLVDYGVAFPVPTVDATWFFNTPGAQSGGFASSSPYMGDASIVWFVDFGSGFVSTYSRSSAYFVRLVRAGQ